MISVTELSAPNVVTREQLADYRARFHGKLSPQEAKAVLGGAGNSSDAPPIVRVHAIIALLELRQGRSVQSAMARFRRNTGIDRA
jgi:hypothetical protein